MISTKQKERGVEYRLLVLFVLLISHILNLFRIDLSIMLVPEEGLYEKRMDMADSYITLYCLFNSMECLALAKGAGIDE